MWAKKLRVLIDKMVGSNQTLITIRMVRSKLRKREESNNNSHPGHPGHGRPQDGAKCAVPATPALNGQSHLGNGVSHAAMEPTVVVTTTPAVSQTSSPVAPSAPAAPVATAASPPPACDACDASHAAETPAPQPLDLELFLWSRPASRSACGTQLSLYRGDQDALVHSLPCDEPRECKGFRKNLRGKWKRLVKKKQPGPDVYAIPPELRDQLKQIYVY